VITGVDHSTVVVSGLGRSFPSYTQVVGLKRVWIFAPDVMQQPLKPVARWARGAYPQAGRVSILGGRVAADLLPQASLMRDRLLL
jgi:hypothetical protein